GDGLAGRDARARDRLGDELERATARRGRAVRRRAGDARRRRERARRGAVERTRDDRSHGRRVDARGARAGDGGAARRGRLRVAAGDRGREGGRPLQAAQGGRTGMTTVEVPYSIAAALPSLSVMDIRNDVSREVAESGVSSGIAYLHGASTLSLVRVQERETGFFEDLEQLLEQVVPGKLRS